MNKITLSIIIPAYNEEINIKSTINKIINYFKTKNITYEIIVINDGSIDNTSGIVRKFKNRRVKLYTNKENKGKGYSVRRGIFKARYKYILYLDADFSTRIEEFSKAKKLLKDHEIVIASRNLPESKIVIKQPLIRSIMGKTFSLLVRLFINKNIKDSQCGFKIFKKNTARKIFPLCTINDFGFDVEVLFIAKKLGFRVKEFPIHWYNRSDSKLKVQHDAVKMFLDLIIIRVNDLKGKYNLK